MELLTEDLIGPCGMNCGICRAYLRPRNPCAGCQMVEPDYPKTIVQCKIRTCRERSGRFCFSCSQFPCDWLKHIDKRYRTKYGMSEIENLEFIRDHGMEAFILSERARWQSELGTFCVHDKQVYP